MMMTTVTPEALEALAQGLDLSFSAGLLCGICVCLVIRFAAATLAEYRWAE